MIRRAARPETHFTILRNDVLRDSRLSFRARGLLAAILSRPDNWSIRADQLCHEGHEGRGAIHTALDELRKCGYLKTNVYRTDKGHFVTEQVIYDTPQLDDDDQPDTDGPKAEIRYSDSRNSGDRQSDSRKPLEETLRSTDKKKREEGTKKNLPATFVADDLFDEFYAVFPKKRDPNDARRAWVKAIKKTDPHLLIQRAKEYAEQRAGKDPKYTKYPATWLNKGSWADIPDEPFESEKERMDRSVREAAARVEADRQRRAKELGA